MSLERAATTLSNGVLYMKLAVWTAFALVGPIASLVMRNYLGVAITGGIGVLIGLGLPSPEKKIRALLALRIALVAQGLAASGFGAYMLARPSDPWVHAVGHTRTAIALARSGNVYALEFTEKNSGFFVRNESGSWTRSVFPGFLASEIALGPGDAVVYAREDRAALLWTRGADDRWERRQGFGFPSSLAASDIALFIAAKGSLFRINSPKAPAQRVPDVPSASVVCANGRRLLAIQPKKTEQSGSAWQSDDGGASFTEIPDASLDASICAIADDGTLWVVAAGVFSGEVSVAAPGARFESRNMPAPRAEAIVVNPSDGREAWIGAWGAGIYRSLDGGTSWTLMGLEGYEVSALHVDFARHRAYAGTGSGVFELVF